MAQVDFAAASTRHLRDARFLCDSGRYDNSFYLSGYVAECGLKAVADWAGLVAQKLGHKLLRLEGEALELAVALSPATARYRPDPLLVRAINDAWSTSCRYRSDGVDHHQAEDALQKAKSIWEASVGEMFLDGLIQELP